jgi:tRNA pseudouridine38-40 synthase
LQNFFHFDFQDILHPQFVYKINAILPGDIVVKSVRSVADDAHCRFDAISRTYEYFIYRGKDPFLEDRAWYFPYTIDQDALQHAARVIMEYHDFTSFSKRNTQVKTFDCSILESAWTQREEGLVYRVRANRFLRGMVRALVATMLQVGRGTLTIDQFRAIIDAKDCTRASFAAPSHGLFLVEVCYKASL